MRGGGLLQSRGAGRRYATRIELLLLLQIEFQTLFRCHKLLAAPRGRRTGTIPVHSQPCCPVGAQIRSRTLQLQHQRKRADTPAKEAGLNKHCCFQQRAFLQTLCPDLGSPRYGNLPVHIGDHLSPQTCDLNCYTNNPPWAARDVRAARVLPRGFNSASRCGVVMLRSPIQRFVLPEHEAEGKVVPL